MLSTVILYWKSIVLYMLPHTLPIPLKNLRWDSHQVKSLELPGTENLEYCLLLCFNEAKICMFTWKAKLRHQSYILGASQSPSSLWATLCLHYACQQSLPYPPLIESSQCHLRAARLSEPGDFVQLVKLHHRQEKSTKYRNYNSQEATPMSTGTGKLIASGAHQTKPNHLSSGVMITLFVNHVEMR